MDFAAEATIVAELMKFAESGQLYRGAKPVMWSPVEKTALAEAEVEYEDIVSTQIDVAFEITKAPNAPQLQEAIDAGVRHLAVIWTTTPWTIPVNQALAFGEHVEYAVYELADGRRVVLGMAPGLTAAALARMGEVEKCLGPIRGSLLGAEARHPMHALGGFFAKPRPFLDGSDFVTTETGTGLVHMAPDHGEDDFALCKSVGIEPVFAVEGDGKYRADWLWLGGLGSVINPKFNAPDGPICEALREAGGLLAASADYKHSYPHSWRSKAKVIYRCTPQWFVPMDRELAPSASLRSAPPPEGEDLASGNPPPLGEVAAGTADGGGLTLRETALKAITNTRWVPEKGENRIRSMVEGRPDWVLSRQRAWGVPITLFVAKGTNQYLDDPAVGARIVAGIREGGVDAWSETRAQEYLGADYKAEDYERVTDILDVWFDSGCTHAFVLESGKWPDLVRPAGYEGPWADLYLEGSDQHRGWFQSSLLESCGTRGHAPYKAVLTHGFTMDQKGMKMSKSLGNTIDPIKVMETNGADIIRLWALSVDYTEDHRIGDEILKGVADQYRKLRNTFRYLLGALDGFSGAERVDVAAMPELERYVLALLAKLDGTLKQAVADFDFNTYVRALTDFCNEDLSAFFFDIRKDSLYCDAADDPKRMAYRSVLDTLFHALVRYAAPVLVFTAEEVWGTRFPEGGSVHLLEWPALIAKENAELVHKWAQIRGSRMLANEQIEPLRRDKTIRSSLEAEYSYPGDPGDTDLAEIFIVAAVHPKRETAVTRTTHHKCGRCWRHLPDVAEDGTLCSRCDKVVAGMDAA
jgi:isoleucyl-tRNA synthetase